MKLETQKAPEKMKKNWFVNPKHVRDVIEDWRKGYNRVRPHNSLKGNTSKEHAKTALRLQSVVLLMMV